MKALSGLEPWWTAILKWGKRIENRVGASSAHKQLVRYRAPFLLHVSAGIGALGEFDAACSSIRKIIDDSDWMAFRREHIETRMRQHTLFYVPKASLPRGGIVGRARVVGLIRPDGRPLDGEAERAIARLKPDMRWHIPGQWGHILDEVEPLPFVPCKGALGLWECDYESLLQRDFDRAGEAIAR